MKLFVLIVLTSLSTSFAFAAETFTLSCKGQMRGKGGNPILMTVKMASDSELISAKAFYYNLEGQVNTKPVFAGGIGHQVGAPAKRSPDTTLTFKSEGFYMDSTTLYLSNKLSALRGKTTTALVVMTADGVEPGVADFVCSVK